MRNAGPEYTESIKRRYKDSIKLRPELNLHQNLTGTGIFKEKIKSTKNKPPRNRSGDFRKLYGKELECNYNPKEHRNLFNRAPKPKSAVPGKRPVGIY